MILTEEFLQQQKACIDGIFYAGEKRLFGLDYDEVIRETILDGKRDFAGWLIEQKSTEGYVRANGKDIVMGTYKIFNPITGQYIECQNQDEVRVAAVSITKDILQQHAIGVVQCITNENGNVAWLPSNLETPLEIK